jgi:hypothetical protein
MPRNTDKPQILDADAINPSTWEGFVRCRKRPIIISACKMSEGFKVTSLEGVQTGKPGDYLMIGVKGEKYICAADVFEATYDIIDD